MDWTDEVVLVTGAAQGIGEQVAIGFAQAGAIVAVADIKHADVKKVAEKIRSAGGRSMAIPLDISDKSQNERMVQEVVHNFGRIDVLVNCAGVLKRADLLTIEEKDWDFCLDVNAKGTFLACQAVCNWMVANQSPGRIVNFASITTFVAIENLIPYMASKGAVGMMTKGMALEMAKHGIRINAVAPGPVRTPMTADRFADPAQKAWLEENVPLNRVAEPEEIFQAVRFLADKDASFITGTVLPVDGGWTIK